MDRNLALETVRATEAAAISSSRLMGMGDNNAADQAAVDAMRKALNSIAIDGIVVIGEGERDEAPMLYIGEKVGTGKGPTIDIALEPTCAPQADQMLFLLLPLQKKATFFMHQTPTWKKLRLALRQWELSILS